MYDWNDLRHFLAVARSGSMGAAARSLRINQSTVQRRVAALQKGLGCALIEPTSRGYKLTDNGERLLRHAETVETAAYAFQRQAELLASIATGRVRVTSLVTIGERIIRAGFLDRFHAMHPGIFVEVLMDQRVLDLSKGEADVAIRGGGPGSESLVGRKIADLPWAIFASRAFVERHGRPQSIADLENFSIVELVDELDKIPAAFWMKAHAPTARIAARCGNIPSAHMAVRSGAGLAPLPAVFASEDNNLVCVLGPIPELDYPVYLFTHKALRTVPRIKLFCDFCVRELKPVLLTGKMRATVADRQNTRR